jgi:hypothetical protein
VKASPEEFIQTMASFGKKIDWEGVTKTVLIFGVGFVLGCHLGSYFLATFALVAMIVTLVHVME